MTSIGDSAFEGCSGLAWVWYPGDAEGWEQVEGTGSIPADKLLIGDIRSGSCQIAGDDLTDAPASACYQCHFSFQGKQLLEISFLHLGASFVFGFQLF